MQRVLILNRGEIACRLIQACQELGLHSIAVYSEPDAGARHVSLADEAIALPGSSAKESYLNLSLILERALSSGADAVHPGYGFLSERSEAAEAFCRAGIRWIGPSPQSIRLLGDKLQAKKLLEKYRVPTAPWAELASLDAPHLIAASQKVGFPLLLKAASGGGGKGMRLVKNEAELQTAAESAAREALASFGDATVLMERFVERPRHVEIQILGDEQGHVMHLGERECSLQRRHQKVIEEAPAPRLSRNTREAMAECAVSLARGVGYSSAGTVEFLVDEQENFFFLEVNSRLQVEHSVTEAVWGVDLVHAQLRIAQGLSLSEIFPEQPRPRGHAMQARIYAEDAARGFAPCPGELSLVEWPSAVGLRVDAGVKSGSVVGMEYDAMIAKLTAHAPDRESAIARLLWGLRNCVIFGTTTNINYLQDLLGLPELCEGRMHVKLLETKLAEWNDPVPQELLAAHSSIRQLSQAPPAPSRSTPATRSPWEAR